MLCKLSLRWKESGLQRTEQLESMMAKDKAYKTSSMPICKNGMENLHLVTKISYDFTKGLEVAHNL